MHYLFVIFYISTLFPFFLQDFADLYTETKCTMFQSHHLNLSWVKLFTQLQMDPSDIIIRKICRQMNLRSTYLHFFFIYVKVHSPRHIFKTYPQDNIRHRQLKISETSFLIMYGSIINIAAVVLCYKVFYLIVIHLRVSYSITNSVEL